MINNPVNLTDPTGLVNNHGDSRYPWEEDPLGDIPWTAAGEHEAYDGSTPPTLTEHEALALNEQILAADPQNSWAQFLSWTHDQNSKFGHTGLLLQDGTYISYWPTCFFGKDPQPFKHCPARPSNYDADVEGEGNRAPQVIRITGLDERAIRQWWNGGKGHGDFSLWNNCSNIVSEALRVGGLPIRQTTVYSTPDYRVWQLLTQAM